MFRAARPLALFVLLVAAACGGTSANDEPSDPGSPPGGTPGPVPPGPTPPPPTTAGPDVALLLVGGHSPLGLGADYFETAVGPYLAGEVQAAGYTVQTFGFVDAGTGTKGFGDLLARLRTIRDGWVVGRAAPTRVFLLAHSHGGPWVHAATRDVPDCPVRGLVDLDTNSYGWFLAHTADNALLGGSPDNQYVVNVNVNPPAYPLATSEAGFTYDLEDVVFPSVRDALEVVTGDLVPSLTVLGTFQRYDERWNARLDGTTTGLAYLFTATLHGEPATPPNLGGTTIVAVKDWILGRLAVP